MVKHLISATLGAAMVAALFHFVLFPAHRDSYLAIGEVNGAISAKSELVTTLKREFPLVPESCAVKSTLFEVKSTTVYVVDCNGSRFLSVHE